MKIDQIKRHDLAFQQPVNEQDLRLQLNRELAGEKVIEIAELDSGLFNTTYRVNTSKKSYILKIAPQLSADVLYNERYLMQREQSIAKQIQSASPLIPEYLSFFKVDGRDAFLQPFIQGRLWHDVISSLTEEENAALWTQLGTFAKIFHENSGEKFGYPAPYKGFTHWSEFIFNNVEGMVEDCRRFNILCEEIEVYLRHLPSFFPALDQVKTPKLLHGDLWPRNVIIDGEGANIHLTAVIDAERAFWGDPTCDWVLILYDVPEAFWQGYGENLLETSDLSCITIYKGMYFILNILEAGRFQKSDEAPRKWLSEVNKELEKLLP